MLTRLRIGLCIPLVTILLVIAGPTLAGGKRVPIVYPDKVAQPPRVQSAPDVQVLVFGPKTGVDQVNITYPTVVPRAQVARDINSLAALSSWPMGGVLIQNTAMPLIGVKAVPMTSVTFDAQGAVRNDQKAFWLEPFVVALRPYKKLSISYMVPKEFAFSGLQNYSDSHVHIALQRHGLVYTYLVAIDNPNFTRLNLPMWQPTSGVQADVVRQASLQHRARSLRVLKFASLALVGALAVLVGFGVYAMLSRSV
jgi:hypothetical protein